MTDTKRQSKIACALQVCRRGWGWSQFRVTFLKMNLTYLDFTILVGCVSLPLEAIIRAHLLQSFLFLLEQCLWSVAGLLCYFFCSLFPEEGSIVLQSPHPEFWTMTMNLRSSGSALLIMWFVSLRAESDYYSEKWKGFLVTDMCVQVLCKKTSRNSFSVFWEEATNYEKLFMGSIFNINFIVMFSCVFVNLGTLHLKNCLEIPKCTKINKYACFMVKVFFSVRRSNMTSNMMKTHLPKTSPRSIAKVACLCLNKSV